jgi:regulator of protease activity HflC (stomatin/prohibitin superfamily)
VDIRKLELDEGTKAAMRQQIESSRECGARKLLAQGEADAVKTRAEGEAAALERRAEAERNSAVLRAEGQAEAVRLRAEGEKKYLAMLVESLGSEAAAEILVAEKTFGSFAAIAAGRASKVYLETPKMPTVESLAGTVIEPGKDRG